MNKVLFIAVHPDDETLGCGGTILKHKASGDEIYWLILTTIRNHPQKKYDEDVVRKRDETINKVNQEYCFNQVIELSLPTILLHTVDISKLISLMDCVINDIKPTVIYTMFKGDVHSDHRVAFDAVYSCTKSFRKPFIEEIYMYEVLSETEFAPAIPGVSFVPNVYVDITDFMDKKIEIMSLYYTEVMNSPYPRSLSSIEALARVRGSRCGTQYAEAFMLLFKKS